MTGIITRRRNETLSKSSPRLRKILNSTASGVAVPANAEQERKYEQRRA